MGMGGSLEIDGGSDVSSSNLDDLADVTITSPADNQVLTYDSGTSEWVNQDAGTNQAQVLKLVSFRG